VNTFKVSVIIRAYNAAKFIQHAIKSIVEQSYSGPIEIVVCYDEGSMDDTLKIVYKMQNNLPSNRSISVCQHPHTTLFRATQLYALTSYNGYWVTFLDYDNIMPKNYVDTVIAHVHTASFIFSKVMPIDENGNIIKNARNWGRVPKNPINIQRLIKGNYIDANTVWLKRDCAEAIRKMLINKTLMHRYFDWLNEDWLIALLGMKYFRTYYVDNAFVLYRFHKSQLTSGLANEDMYKKMFNLEMNIKTLMAFYEIAQHDLTSEEIRQLESSVLTLYINYLRCLSAAKNLNTLRTASRIYSLFHKLLNKVRFLA